MNDRQYFLTTSLSYQLRAARQELSSFRSGDALSFSLKKITRQWMDVLEDVRKEHEKEIGKLKKAIAELLDIVASLKNRNAERKG